MVHIVRAYLQTIHKHFTCLLRTRVGHFVSRHESLKSGVLGSGHLVRQRHLTLQHAHSLPNGRPQAGVWMGAEHRGRADGGDLEEHDVRRSCTRRTPDPRGR